MNLIPVPEKTGSSSEDADARRPPWVLIDDRGPDRTGAAFKSFSHPEDFGKTGGTPQKMGATPAWSKTRRLCRTPQECPHGTNPNFKCVLTPRLPLSTATDAGSDAAGVVKAAGAAFPPGLTTMPTSIPDSSVEIWCYCHGNRLV